LQRVAHTLAKALPHLPRVAHTLAKALPHLPKVLHPFAKVLPPSLHVLPPSVATESTCGNVLPNLLPQCTTKLFPVATSLIHGHAHGASRLNVSAFGGRATPRSVNSAVMSAAGVTSNAGLRAATPSGPN